MYPRTFLQHSILQHNIPKLGTESSPARPHLMCPRAANIQDIQASLRFDSVEGSFLWFKGQKQQLRQRQKVSRISNLHNLAEGLGGNRGLRIRVRRTGKKQRKVAKRLERCKVEANGGAFIMHTKTSRASRSHYQMMDHLPRPFQTYRTFRSP